MLKYYQKGQDSYPTLCKDKGLYLVYRWRAAVSAQPYLVQHLDGMMEETMKESHILQCKYIENNGNNQYVAYLI